MPIMCYEQFIKKLFKSKSSSRSEHELKKSAQSDKLPRKRVNLDCKQAMESDESWGSSTTGVELFDSDTCSGRSSRSMHSTVCKNCTQSVDLRTFRRHYSEYLSPQQTTIPVTNINLPPTVRRPAQLDLMAVDSRTCYQGHQKRRRTWNHIKCSLTTATSTEKLESNCGTNNSRRTHSYQFNKTFHSPPPNRNPFDIDTDIR